MARRRATCPSATCLMSTRKTATFGLGNGTFGLGRTAVTFQFGKNSRTPRKAARAPDTPLMVDVRSRGHKRVPAPGTDCERLAGCSNTYSMANVLLLEARQWNQARKGAGIRGRRMGETETACSQSVQTASPATKPESACQLRPLAAQQRRVFLFEGLLSSPPHTRLLQSRGCRDVTFVGGIGTCLPKSERPLVGLRCVLRGTRPALCKFEREFERSEINLSLIMNT